MPKYEVINVGALDQWRDFIGGWSAHNTREGRRVVDHEIQTQYIGLTVNALVPGQEDAYWHDHAEVEEIYMFLSGRGQMALDDDVIDVGPGSVIRVGQNVMRTYRALPETPEDLRFICIRAGGSELGVKPTDATVDWDRAKPWA